MKITINMEKREWSSIISILRCYESTPILEKFEKQIDDHIEIEYQKSKQNAALDELVKQAEEKGMGY